MGVEGPRVEGTAGAIDVDVARSAFAGHRCVCGALTRTASQVDREGSVGRIVASFEVEKAAVDIVASEGGEQTAGDVDEATVSFYAGCRLAYVCLQMSSVANFGIIE